MVRQRSRFLAAAIAAVGVVLAVGLGGRFGAERQLNIEELAVRAAPAAPVPIESLTFDAAAAEAESLPRLHSLLVSVDGQLRLERYFNGFAAGRTANMKSASKSVMSILVGIAIDRGILPGVSTPIGRYFPEQLRKEPEKQAITIEQLLTMQSGLESTSSRNYGRWIASNNWVSFVLQQPLVDEPGGRMIYSTGSTHLLSAILTRATKSSTLAFARTALAQPLGITIGAWTRDPQGIYLGGNEMAMRPRDMLRLGELYLNGGRHNGRQLVSDGWVQASILPRTTSRWGDREYGYGWWLRTLADQPVFYAWGYGGQFIFVVPSVRTVVVATSAAEPGSERREHLDAVYDLLEDEIIPEAGRAFPEADTD